MEKLLFETKPTNNLKIIEQLWDKGFKIYTIQMLMN